MRSLPRSLERRRRARARALVRARAVSFALRAPRVLCCQRPAESLFQEESHREAREPCEAARPRRLARGGRAAMSSSDVLPRLFLPLLSAWAADAGDGPAEDGLRASLVLLSAAFVVGHGAVSASARGLRWEGEFELVDADDDVDALGLVLEDEGEDENSRDAGNVVRPGGKQSLVKSKPESARWAGHFAWRDVVRVVASGACELDLVLEDRQHRGASLRVRLVGPEAAQEAVQLLRRIEREVRSLTVLNSDVESDTEAPAPVRDGRRRERGSKASRRASISFDALLDNTATPSAEAGQSPAAPSDQTEAWLPSSAAAPAAAPAIEHVAALTSPAAETAGAPAVAASAADADAELRRLIRSVSSSSTPERRVAAAAEIEARFQYPVSIVTTPTRERVEASPPKRHAKPPAAEIRKLRPLVLKMAEQGKEEKRAIEAATQCRVLSPKSGQRAAREAGHADASESRLRYVCAHTSRLVDAAEYARRYLRFVVGTAHREEHEPEARVTADTYAVDIADGVAGPSRASTAAPAPPAALPVLRSPLGPTVVLAAAAAPSPVSAAPVPAAGASPVAPAPALVAAAPAPATALVAAALASAAAVAPAPLPAPESAQGAAAVLSFASLGEAVAASLKQMNRDIDAALAAHVERVRVLELEYGSANLAPKMSAHAHDGLDSPADDSESGKSRAARVSRRKSLAVEDVLDCLSSDDEQGPRRLPPPTAAVRSPAPPANHRVLWTNKRFLP